MSLDDVMGMNRRNIDYIMELNRREHYTLVADKLTTKTMLNKNGIPTAPILAVCDAFFGINRFIEKLSRSSRFVVKPSRGSGGNGIVVVKWTEGGYWTLSGDKKWHKEQQQEHIENILYGTFSLDSTGDAAFAEDLIESHPGLCYFTEEGLPDIRLIACRRKLVAAMLRVPTRRSRGKANLHAGGFALGIDLSTGITGRGWYCGRYINCHPETGVSLAGQKIPCWNEMIGIGSQLQELFPLGYMGIDMTVDALRGPLVLELNARPGLEIQNVTGCGMRSILERMT
jgi:alpha-L-glutamate ligase-like protein